MPDPSQDNGHGLTVRELLLEVRSDVKEMKPQLDILVSQDLNQRVTKLENTASFHETEDDTRVGMLRFGRDAITLVISLVAAMTAALALLGR